MRLFFFISAFMALLLTQAQDTNYQSIVLDEDLTKNANAVVRLDEMTVDILSQENMLITSKRVITVLNRHGNRHVRAFAGYDNSRKVKSVKAIVYNSFGKEIKKIKEKDFRDVSAVSGGTLYSDSRVKYLEYTPTQYPYTIVFEKEVQTKNTAFIPDWYFLDSFLVSVENSSFTVNFPNGTLKPSIKEKNIQGYKIEKEETATSITYKGDNIEAIKSEELSPSFSKLAPRLILRLDNFYYEGYTGKASNWNQLGSWMYNNLLTGRNQLSNQVKQEIIGLVKGVEGNLEKAKIVYEYVQGRTRYISVQVGIGGIQPITALDVDRVKYGDCKGLSNYTQALLKAAGVESYYTHVEAGPDKVDFEYDFATLAQGNHAILAIPSEEGFKWIDCTSQILPFGFIGDFTDGRKVFVIKPDGGEVVTTESYLEKDNSQKIEARIELGSEGGIKASANIETRGIQYDNRFQIQDFDKDEVLEKYQESLSFINNLSLDTYTFKNDKKKVVFTEDVVISAQNYATASGNRLLFAPNAFNRNTFVPKRHRVRKLPFEIQRGFYDEDSYTIKLPEGYAIEAIPEPKNIDSEFGTYTLSVSKQEDGSLKYQRTFFLKSGEYPKEKYAAYRTFRKTVAKYENSQVVLLKS